MRKTLIKIASLIMAAAMVLPVVGCNKVKDTGKNCLDVYVIKKGYGVEWARQMLDAFIEEDWVKEQFGEDVRYTFYSDENTSFVSNNLKGGSRAFAYDLLMGISLDSDLLSSKYVQDLTNTVYKARIPGENVTYEEKCLDSYNESSKDVSVKQTTGNTYYSAPWAGGNNTICYDEELLALYTDEVPRTTDELLKVCDDALKDKGKTDKEYNFGYSFVHYQGIAYWSYLLPIWWAQYDGYNSYCDYWQGRVRSWDPEENDWVFDISTEIFDQQGRMESLKLFKTFLEYDKYLDPTSLGQTITVVQQRFLKGQGLFYVCGDWYDNEMKDSRESAIAAGESVYTIKQMRTPIVSAIVDKLDYYTIAHDGTKMPDATLSSIIKAIDEGATQASQVDGLEQYAGVQEDFDYIREARGVVQAVGPGHQAVIPNRAGDKALAQAFLLYMASDKGNEIYTRATNGATLPFEYNVETKNAQLYNSLSPMQKDRIKYFNSANLTINVLPYESSYPLVKYGGLTMFRDKYGNNKAEYWKQYATSEYKNGQLAADNTFTPEQLYAQTKEYYTKSENKNWNTALTRAGLI